LTHADSLELKLKNGVSQELKMGKFGKLIKNEVRENRSIQLSTSKGLNSKAVVKSSRM